MDKFYCKTYPLDIYLELNGKRTHNQEYSNSKYISLPGVVHRECGARPYREAEVCYVILMIWRLCP